MQSNGGVEYAGTTIADAVRLEAVGGPGEMLVDVPTWSALPKSLQAFYGPKETVAGKRDERFGAHRYRVLPDAPRIERHAPARAKPELNRQREAVVLIDRIESIGQLEKLIFLIEMPVAERPSPSLTLDERRSAVLLWASTKTGCGVDALIDSLKVVLGLEGTAEGDSPIR